MGNYIRRFSLKWVIFFCSAAGAVSAYTRRSLHREKQHYPHLRTNYFSIRQFYVWIRARLHYRTGAAGKGHCVLSSIVDQEGDG